MVYTLAEILSGGADVKDKIIKLNGGEYQEQSRHNLARLLGSPPGYRGSEDPSIPGSGAKVIFSQENLDAHRIYYTDRNGNQRSVIFILVDEAEKADRSFHMAFLSILDKGQLDIGNNITTIFSDAVIFYTSNVGNEKVEQLHEQRVAQGTDQVIPETFREAVDEALFSNEDKEIIRQEFISAFPPEFRGRIKETVVFNHLSREAVTTIAGMKVKEVQQAFAESGIRIELDLSPAALDWLTKNGYSRSEGARGMEKLVDKNLHEALIRLDSARDVDALATGIHWKRIGVDVKEDGTGLDFYFGDGYQLEDFSPEQTTQIAASAQQATVAKQQQQNPQTDIPKRPESIQMQRPPILKVGIPLQIGRPPTIAHTQRPTTTEQRATQTSQSSEVPQIPARLKAKLIKSLTQYGLDSYIIARNGFTRQGVLDLNAANMQPEIRSYVADSVLQQYKKYGLDSYLMARNAAVQAGFYSTDGFNNWQAIKDQAQNNLLSIFNKYGMNSFISHRNALIRAGIGTVEEWNQLLNS